MDEFRLLCQRAVAKRDKTIREARAEYSRTLREIAHLAQLLGEAEASKLAVEDRAINKANGKPYRRLTAIQAAERVLSEGKPLTLVELTLEVQRRGCRSEDDPRAVFKSIQSGFYYHRGRFQRGEGGKWKST
jgi:hypothetical protein